MNSYKLNKKDKKNFGIIFSLIIFSLIGCNNEEQKLHKNVEYYFDASNDESIGDYDNAIINYKKLLETLKNNKEDKICQITYLNLAKIHFSKGKYDVAIHYAKKIDDEKIEIEHKYFQIDESIEQEGNRSALIKEENVLSSEWYSLLGSAKKILGLSYQNKGDFETAIKYFENIYPQSQSYYYLAKIYQLKNDLITASKYFKKNKEKGSIGLIETEEFLK